MDADYLWMMILPWVQNEYKRRGASLYRGADEKYRKLYISYICHGKRELYIVAERISNRIRCTF